jgi:uncharacterized membrane protein (UPF0136 family)
MNWSVIGALGYGILAIVGGVMGYATAQSKMSLISGGACGILLVIAGIAQLQGQAWGLTLGLVVTGVLLLAFLMRLIKTRKFMPAGLMLLLGIPVLGVMISRLTTLA